MIEKKVAKLKGYAGRAKTNRDKEQNKDTKSYIEGIHAGLKIAIEILEEDGTNV